MLRSGSPTSTYRCGRADAGGPRRPAHASLISSSSTLRPLGAASAFRPRYAKTNRSPQAELASSARSSLAGQDQAGRARIRTRLRCIALKRIRAGTRRSWPRRLDHRRTRRGVRRSSRSLVASSRAPTSSRRNPPRRDQRGLVPPLGRGAEHRLLRWRGSPRRAPPSPGTHATAGLGSAERGTTGRSASAPASAQEDEAEIGWPARPQPRIEPGGLLQRDRAFDRPRPAHPTRSPSAEAASPGASEWECRLLCCCGMLLRTL